MKQTDLSWRNQKELDRAFGVPVPASYVALLEIVEELSVGGDLWNALPIHFAFDRKAYGLSALPTLTPPELIVCGWTGMDDGHFGFLVDQRAPETGEYPIGEFYSADGSTAPAMASGIGEFVGCLIRAYYDDYRDEMEPDERRRLKRLHLLAKQRLGTVVPRNDRDVLVRSSERRVAQPGIVPTEDGVGLFLPEDSFDRRYLRTLVWPEHLSYRIPTVEECGFMDIAERRLAQGEPGTALLLMRNFWYHYNFDDHPEPRKERLGRMATTLEQSYRALDRHFAADVLRSRVEEDIRLIDEGCGH
jgi:hypothetical protein